MRQEPPVLRRCGSLAYYTAATWFIFLAAYCFLSFTLRDELKTAQRLQEKSLEIYTLIREDRQDRQRLWDEQKRLIENAIQSQNQVIHDYKHRLHNMEVDLGYFQEVKDGREKDGRLD